MIGLVNQVAALLYETNAIIRFICFPRHGNVEDVVVCDVPAANLPPAIKAGVAAAIRQRIGTFDESRERDGSLGIKIDRRQAGIIDDLHDTALELLDAADEISAHAADHTEIITSMVEQFRATYTDYVLRDTPRITELSNGCAAGVITTTLRCELPPC
jgi:hypothetical protein